MRIGKKMMKVEETRKEEEKEGEMSISKLHFPEHIVAYKHGHYALRLPVTTLTVIFTVA